MSTALHGTEIILVRHGETEFNVAGKLQGTLDSPLTAKGVSAARQLGKRLASASRPITACYASPLGRAATTARLVAAELGLGVEIEPRLSERAFGVFQGTTAAERRARHAELSDREALREPQFALPGGGESRAAARARGTEALTDLLARHTGGRVLVVTHSAMISTLVIGMLSVGPNPPDVRHFAVPNTAVNLFRWHNAGWQLVAWGDTGEFDLGRAGAAAPRLSQLASHAAAMVLGAAITRWWLWRRT